MKPATIVQLAIKLKIIPVKEGTEGVFRLSLLNVKHIGWNILFFAFFSVYAYKRYTTIKEFDMNQLVYISTGTIIVSLAPAIQVLTGIMMVQAQDALTYCPNISPLPTILIILNFLVFQTVVMVQDFIHMGITTTTQDCLVGAAVVVSSLISFLMLATQLLTVYTLCISLSNKLDQLIEKVDIDLVDLKTTMKLYTNTQSALEYSGLLIFSTIQIMLVGTIYLLISGASTWSGLISTVTALLVVGGFIHKSEDIYDKVTQVSAKGRESANRQSSLRDLANMKDKENHIFRP